MTHRLLPAAVAAWMLLSAPALAQRMPVTQPAARPTPAPAEKAVKPTPLAPDNYDQQLQHYLEAARATPPPSAESMWMASLFGDIRARRLNDLVTVRVVETVSAQGSADSTLDKSSSAGASVTNLFGAESKFPGFLDPGALATLGANTSFQGGGATQRAGALTAVITARVAEVLPNGDLGIEGIREIDINGDRQMLVLTGVVRAADIGPGNVIPSTAVGQMRIRYFGRGLIKDNLTPGWLVRVLNKIF